VAGTLTIPNLETSMQKHREHLDFAIQSNQVWDAILFAQLINELLPKNNRLKLADSRMMLSYNPNYRMACPSCHERFDVTNEMIRGLTLPTVLEKNFVPPKPTIVTTGDKLDSAHVAWEWLQNYLIKLEGHVSDITWLTLRTTRE
jgi:hypothetical protein